MSKIKFEKVKGVRDFYPEEQAFLNWLFSKMRNVSKLFGYQEYDGPILEYLKLYKAKSGEELVKEQAFILEDKSGRKLALRPEMTPTLARMVAQKGQNFPKPSRWFNIGPRFRYERPQKGRNREFFQWDVDLIGSTSPEADAEVIAIAAFFLKSLGLSPNMVKIKVNDRVLMERKLNLISVPKGKVQQVFKIIDKKPNLENRKWEKQLKEIGLTELQVKDLRGILADKDFSYESENLTRIFATLKDLNLLEYAEFDPEIVRGLDYYTGVVFEAQEESGEFRSILGGGRYDSLVETVGGDKTPGVGFAAGDAVLAEVLKKYGKIPSISPNPAKVLVTVFDQSLFRKSIQIASLLREEKINTILYLKPEKLNKQLKYADNQKIPFVLIIGEKEEAEGKIAIRDMEKKKQETIAQDKLISYLKKLPS